MIKHEIYKILTNLINLDDLVKRKTLEFESIGVLDLTFEFIRFDEQNRLIIAIANYDKEEVIYILDPKIFHTTIHYLQNFLKSFISINSINCRWLLMLINPS
ncbi:hypothetical protein LCGC14_1813150 [marine sediment metagenome]|uniref:Uncharacterized protein n=1 Tax=marine sediment metagenome TaxID=412755 RepID=A0A0F9JKR8_9ZZZZ